MEPSRLTSWKEIAFFLGVDIKTAQRWERGRGLPIHRIPGGRRGGVFAFEQELVEWRDAPATPLPDPVTTQPVAQGPQPGRGRRRLILSCAGALVLIFLVGWALAEGLRNPQDIDRAEVRGRTIFALDKEGGTLWKRDVESRPTPVLPLHDESQFVRTIRWNPKAPPGIIAALNFEKGGQVSGRLSMFDANGRERWSWNAGVDLLDFNGTQFEPAWVLGPPLGDNVGPAPVLWVTVSNSLRWPGVLYRFDESGIGRIQFANAGSIMEVFRSPRQHASRLLIAGINNAWGVPFVADIPADGEAGFSPPGGPDRYRFASGPKGHSNKYILMPGSEIHRVQARPYFYPLSFRAAGQTVLQSVFDMSTGAIIYDYEFAPDLTPLRVRVNSGAIELHHRLEGLGLLKHSAEKCPEFNSPQTLSCWTPEAGWVKISVPTASRLNMN